MLQQSMQDIEKLKKDVERLKDATRDIQFSNGKRKRALMQVPFKSMIILAKMLNVNGNK
jgi:hypothetical protein